MQTTAPLLYQRLFKAYFFHFILHPALGYCFSNGVAPLSATSIAAAKSAPVTSTSVFGLDAQKATSIA